VALNCYVAKALPVKYQITAHTAWHRPIAKTKFVTINSIVTLAEKSLSWSSTTQWSHFSTTTQLLWLLDMQAKSEHSYRHTQSLLEASLEIAK